MINRTVKHLEGVSFHSCPLNDVYFLSTYPLLVTRHWRRPSLRKMSTTVSMGVWSVTVKGLRFRMRRSFSGCGLLAGSCGASSVKYTTELLTTPSCF